MLNAEMLDAGCWMIDDADECGMLGISMKVS
jgi:hypothetical protein